MVTTVNIKCPHCGQAAEIFLSTRVSAVILNCPSCLSPIMYLRRKTFLLDKKKLKTFKTKSRGLLMSSLLEQIADAGGGAHCTVKQVGTAAASFLPSAAPSRNVPRRVPSDREGERYITHDDCINLRIDLALCADSNEFISHL